MLYLMNMVGISKRFQGDNITNTKDLKFADVFKNGEGANQTAAYKTVISHKKLYKTEVSTNKSTKT